MINKIYKYRPLSDFLFKELLYSEIYFASYYELNDPLDLTIKLNFKTSDLEQLDYLIYYLIRVSVFSNLNNVVKSDLSNLLAYAKHKGKRIEVCKTILNKMPNENYVPYESIEEIIISVVKELNICVSFIEFSKELVKLNKIFFENSYTTCFSETFSDFLMWSHYASKHSGICLEFTLNDNGNFPYYYRGTRNKDTEKYLKKYSEWSENSRIYWDEIKKVEYKKELPTISFYDFAPVFENQNDCDLLGLSKSKWHVFANELEKIFYVKTDSWDYEKEWRAIEINFGKFKYPEERISYYPKESLTSIFFGLRTPNEVRKRIHQILSPRNNELNFFEAKISNKRKLAFIGWKFDEE